MSSDCLIDVREVSKCYPLFSQPIDRLKQMVIPRLSRLIHPWSTVPHNKFYQEFWALQGISFTVKRGEMVGIIGCNGSGKSTLLQVVCGTLTPTCGEVRVEGRVAALLELGAGFNPEFTGRENVLMNAAILGLTDQEIADKYDAIVEFSEIGAFMDRPVKTYSSGMFMRLAFSVAVSVEPDLVVVDEALAVGDIGFSMKCMQRIEEMLANGVTFLLVTHDLGLVQTMCSRALYMREGQCMFDGDARTATELFLMDTRGAQAALLEQQMARQKPLLEDGMAFGTGHGKVLSMRLFSAGEERKWFHYGERIEIKVTAYFGERLHHPELAVAVRDARNNVICGLDSRRVSAPLSIAEDGMVSCCFSFDVRMLPGSYAITLRIVDYPVGEMDVLIEKQVNAGIFEVIDGGSVPKGVYGMVDLNGECRQEEVQG